MAAVQQKQCQQVKEKLPSWKMLSCYSANKRQRHGVQSEGCTLALDLHLYFLPLSASYYTTLVFHDLAMGSDCT